MFLGNFADAAGGIKINLGNILLDRHILEVYNIKYKKQRFIMID